MDSDCAVASLRVFCFGLPHAEVAGFGQLRFPTEKSLELLIIAALAPGAQMTRSIAAGKLRMDQPEGLARRALSTDLWRLKKAFAELGLSIDTYMDVSSRGIGICEGADLWIDIRVFEERFDRLAAVPVANLTREQSTELREIAKIYRDDPLPSFDQEWCFILREKLRSKYTALIDMLLQHELSEDRWRCAIGWAQRLIEIDPLLEHAHRALMQCHFLTGNRGLAIRQYADCARVLQHELGIAPSEETTRMYRGLLAVPVSRAQAGDVGAAGAHPAPAPMMSQSDRERPLTDQLSMALGNLNQARALVENVDSALRRQR